MVEKTGNRYKKFVGELKKICNKRKIKLHILGYVGKTKKYPLYALKINEGKEPHKTVCFSAGIHGKEIAGPYAVLKFLKNFDFSKHHKTEIIIFPVANPHGFDKNIDKDWQGRNLNIHFCDKKLSDENKFLYDFIKNESILFFHALHEDCGIDKFYMYPFEKNIKEELVYKKIIKLARKFFPIDTDKKIYRDKAKGGLIINRKDGSFEDRLFRDGVPFTLCTETPSKLSLSKRVNLNFQIMELVMRTALNY